MEIKKVRVEVMRDPLCKISLEIGEHEVAVLQAVHGDAAVTVMEEIADTRPVDDAAEEYSRLAQLYGYDNERRQTYAEIAYGRGPAQLSAALKAAEVKKGSARETAKAAA